MSRRFISNDTSLVDVVHQLRAEQESLQASFRASIAELEVQFEAKFDVHEERMARPAFHFEVWSRQQGQRFNEFEAAAHEESRALSSKLGAEQERRRQLENRLARLESRLLEREHWIESQAEHRRVQACELRERVSIALPPDTRSCAFPRRDASATREIHGRDHEIHGRDHEIHGRETHFVDMHGDCPPPAVSPLEHSDRQQHAADKIRHMGSRASERFTTPDLRSARSSGSGQLPRTDTAASTVPYTAEGARAAKAEADLEADLQSWVLKAQANVDEAEAEARASRAFNRIVQQALSRVETEAQAIKGEAEAEKRASRTDTEARAAQAESDRRDRLRKASIPASHAHDEALSWELASAAGASNERASNEPPLALEQSGDLSDAKVLTWELENHRALWGDGACGELGDSIRRMQRQQLQITRCRRHRLGGQRHPPLDLFHGAISKWDQQRPTQRMSLGVVMEGDAHCETVAMTGHRAPSSHHKARAMLPVRRHTWQERLLAQGVRQWVAQPLVSRLGLAPSISTSTTSGR
eukprot:jgi/Chrpa1/23947/Chrysochromulina_OHIO_Genome00011974-RA